MIKGIGLDVVELHRIENAIKNKERFLERVLTEKEREAYYNFSSFKRKVEFTAGRFAAKEAYAKANGTGIGGELSFQDMEIISDEFGKPEFYIKGEKNPSTFLSITHSEQFVVAQVVIEEV